MTSEFSQIVYKRLDGPIQAHCMSTPNYHAYDDLRVKFHEVTKQYGFQDVAELMSTLLCTYTCTKPPADLCMTVYSVIKDILELVAMYGIDQAKWRSCEDIEAYIDQFKPVLKAFFNSYKSRKLGTPSADPMETFKKNDWRKDLDKDAYHELMDAWKNYIKVAKDVSIPTAVLKLYLHAMDWTKNVNKDDSALYVIDLFTEQYFMAVMENGEKPHPIDDLGQLRNTVESVFRRCYDTFYKE